MGAYYATSPSHSFKESPPTFEVQGYDILFRLNQSVGDTFSMTTGENYLLKIEDILTGRGYIKFLIDQSASDKIAPTSRVWPMAENHSWLNVVNDMLGSIGYAGIWSDWDGMLRCEPYVRPVERAPEWYYTDDPLTTMLSQERSLEHDYFETPNRWVFWRSNMLDDVAPEIGNGLFIYTNQSTGETSVDERDGLIVTRAEGVDAADDGALSALAQSMVDADMTVPTTFNVKTSPNPLHWHFDRMFLSDSASLRYADVMCTTWTQPLPPTSDLRMDQIWSVLVQ
jgi:hypothetical protein